MLVCRFSFEEYAKILRQKVTKFPLETTEVLLDTDGHVLTHKFDIYQGTVAPNYSKLLMS